MASDISVNPEPSAEVLAKPWRPQVIADRDGKWYGNGLRFATREEAFEWAHNLYLRWTVCTDYRAFNEVTGEVLGQ